jgi:hypothetical protein
LVYDFINQLPIVVIVNIFFFATFFFCGKVQYCEQACQPTAGK